jgi:hypothetical protein
MVIGFTTTYPISAYHHWCCELESRSARGAQHYVITFVSDLRQVGGFLQVLRFPPPIANFQLKANYHYHLSSFVRSWLNTFQQDVDIFRKTFWKIRQDDSFKQPCFNSLVVIKRWYLRKTEYNPYEGVGAHAHTHTLADWYPW